MIIEGKVNLLTCNTQLLCDIREAVEVAYSQRVKHLRKVSRKGNTEFLTDFEKLLLDSENLQSELESTSYTTAPYV